MTTWTGETTKYLSSWGGFLLSRDTNRPSTWRPEVSTAEHVLRGGHNTASGLQSRISLPRSNGGIVPSSLSGPLRQHRMQRKDKRFLAYTRAAGSLGGPALGERKAARLVP